MSTEPKSPQAGTHTPETDAACSDAARENAFAAFEILKKISARLETERNELRQQLAEAQRENHELRESVDRAMQCEFARGQESMKAQLASATQEAEQAKRELTDANRRLEEAAALCGKLRSDRDHADAQLTEAQSQLKEKQNLTITGLLSRLGETEAREKDALKRAESVARHHAKCHKERGRYSGFDTTRLICDYEAEVCNEVANGIAALANATPSGAEYPHPLSKLNDLLWKMSGLKLPAEDKNEPNQSVS